MKKIVFATGNEGKLREIRMILADLEAEVISMKEAGADGPIEENGTTFEENALIKARTVCARTGLPTLADDSGLVIDHLGGEPGVWSARYLGEDTPYDVKNRIILERMQDAGPGERAARFVCAAALALPDGRSCTVSAAMEGEIGYEIAGENGFGYDPIFFLPEYGLTSAQISPEEKNRISHRGKALEMMKEKLRQLL